MIDLEKFVTAKLVVKVDSKTYHFEIPAEYRYVRPFYDAVNGLRLKVGKKYIKPVKVEDDNH